MATDPDLYLALTTDELREVTRFALAAARDAAGLVGGPLDPRVTAALDAARRFADGERRSKLQRTAATAAHRAGADATDPVARHVACAAGDAAASAYLHPLARGTQVGHILRSTAHAACAAHEATGDPRAADRVIDAAVVGASAVVRDVLGRYPRFPAGSTRVAALVAELDARLRDPAA